MNDKKIRFTVPNFVNEITFRDIENFDIKINSFFNRLFTSSYTNVDKYPFKKSSGNKKIQFNLNKEYSVFNLSRISKVTPIKFRKNKRYLDLDYIDKINKNFDPFLSYGNIVKVRLTDQGKNWFKRISHYKPTLIKIEGDIYYCESSDRKAIIYFSRFYNEAEILEPLSLRKKIKALLEDTLLNYD